MSRARLLLLVPALLVGVAAVLTVTRQIRGPADATSDPDVTLNSTTLHGVRFLVESRAGVTGAFRESSGGVWVINRNQDYMQFHEGTLLVNGTAFLPPSPGDMVRWNLDGPLLINDQPVTPHRFQPRPLDSDPTELKWDIRNPADAPRDSLTADWSRVGHVLVTAHGDGVVRVWDVDKGTVRTEIAPPAPTDGRKRWGFKAAVSPDGKTVAAANVQVSAVTLWEADTGKQLAAHDDVGGKLTDLRFGSDSCLLETHPDGLYARDLTSGRRPAHLSNGTHGGLPASFAVADEVRAENSGRTVNLTHPESPCALVPGVPAAIIFGVSDESSIALTRDGSRLVVAGTDKFLIFDTASGKQRRQLWRRKRADGTTPTIGTLAFFADGKTLAVGAADGLHLYDVETGLERGWVQTLAIRSLAVSGDGAFLAATAEHGPAVYLWRTADLQPK